jgi:enterobactin synthetase component D
MNSFFPSLRSFTLVQDLSSFNESMMEQVAIPSSLSNATKNRQLEFCRGRALAMECLKKIGRSPEQIKRGRNREPIWPSGIVGSISHTKELVVAVVGEKKDILTLGVDLEQIGRVRKDVCRMIKNNDDLDSCEFIDEKVFHTILFSSKESLYKALYPEVKKFFGFEDACLCELGHDQFTLQLRRTLTSDYIKGMKITGYWKQYQNHIISIIEILSDKNRCFT